MKYTESYKFMPPSIKNTCRSAAFHVCCIITSFNTTTAFAQNSNTLSTATSIETCMTTFHSSGAKEGVPLPSTEQRYVLKFEEKRKVVTEPPHDYPAGQLSECVIFKKDKRKENIAAYKKIMELFKSQSTSQELHPKLVETLKRIENEVQNGWGSVENSVIASPNGEYAVLRVSYMPLFLINTSTLSFRKMSIDHSEYKTAIAWSPDSKLFAYAPPDTNQLRIYDVLKDKVITTKRLNGYEVKELAWSPDHRQIASFELKNRKMSKNPLGLLMATAGHPDFSNDALLSVYEVDSDKSYSVMLKKKMREFSTPDIDLNWK